MFYETEGTNAIHNTTKVDAQEFPMLWNTCVEIVNEQYNIGFGHNSLYAAKYMFLMLLTNLEFGGQWEVLARVFSLKWPTFERMMTKFVSILSEPL